MRMNIEIDSSDPRFNAVVMALAGQAAPAPAAGEATTKTRAATPAEKKAAEPKAEEPKAEPAEDRVALLKSLAMKFAQANGREALVSLFAEFGATNPSTVPAKELDAVIARLQE